MASPQMRPLPLPTRASSSASWHVGDCSGARSNGRMSCILPSVKVALFPMRFQFCVIRNGITR